MLTVSSTQCSLVDSRQTVRCRRGGGAACAGPGAERGAAAPLGRLQPAVPLRAATLRGPKSAHPRAVRPGAAALPSLHQVLSHLHEVLQPRQRSRHLCRLACVPVCGSRQPDLLDCSAISAPRVTSKHWEHLAAPPEPTLQLGTAGSKLLCHGLQVPMRCAGGGQALAELRGLRRSRRLRAEVPLPSSLPTAEPLPLPGPPCSALLRSAVLCLQQLPRLGADALWW